MTSIRNLDLGAGGLVVFVGVCWKGVGSRFVPKFWAVMGAVWQQHLSAEKVGRREESQKGRLSGDG